MKTYKVGNPDPFGGLWWIALHFKVSYDAIQRANPQLASRKWHITEGELLNIPVLEGEVIVGPITDPTVFQLKNDLRKIISGPNFKAASGYGRVRDRIKAASAQEKREALADQPFLTSLRAKMFFNDFAKAVELLGRQSPTGQDLIKNPVVIAALDAAWKDSNVAAGYPNRREHGGYFFMNVITGQISTATAPPGTDWGSMKLPDPTPPDGTICVANFHTHPNPEEGFDQECSERDSAIFQVDGVPGLVRSAKGTFTCGPERRLHLGGWKGYPGPSGGEPP